MPEAESKTIELAPFVVRGEVVVRPCCDLGKDLFVREGLQELKLGEIGKLGDLGYGFNIKSDKVSKSNAALKQPKILTGKFDFIKRRS